MLSNDLCVGSATFGRHDGQPTRLFCQRGLTAKQLQAGIDCNENKEQFQLVFVSPEMLLIASAKTCCAVSNEPGRCCYR